jgi:hypothetical protein
MRIDGLMPIQQPDPKGKKTSETKKAAEIRPDKVQLGNKAPEAGYAEELKKGRPVQSTPSQDVQEAKQRNEKGYYDTPEVKQATSEKLIDSNELKDIVQNYHESNLAKEIQSTPVEVRHDKVAEVRQKLSDGFYNDPSNYGLFVDKIIGHFGL